jgi:Flp pilus assembly CpaE family ATPase
VYDAPRLRVALGLGDQELEQRLRPALDAADDLVVVAQCLAADQVVHVVESHQVDALVIAWSLHRLTDAVLAQIDRSGLPVVLLVPDPEDERWRTRSGSILPLVAEPAAIRQRLLAGRRGERVLRRSRTVPDPVTLKPAERPVSAAADTRVIAIAGGAGSPGRTTVAINLAAALGAAVTTALLEIDLGAPALAAYLDRDPSRNLCTLAHAVREDPRQWASALTDELQPLSERSPSVHVLCGPPKLEMRSSITPQFVERLIAELAHRHRYVIVDVGSELLGIESAAANHRAALVSAQRVLVVSGSDLVSLWRTRTTLELLDRQLGIARASVGLVLNRHDPRYHHPPDEVEWHLGAPVHAVVPYDRAAERAVAQQHPLVEDPPGRAGRALLGLAQLIHEAKVPLPMHSKSAAGRVTWWQRLVHRPPVLRTAQHRVHPDDHVHMLPARDRAGEAG